MLGAAEYWAQWYASLKHYEEGDGMLSFPPLLQAELFQSWNLFCGQSNLNSQSNEAEIKHKEQRKVLCKKWLYWSNQCSLLHQSRRSSKTCTNDGRAVGRKMGASAT